MYVHVPKGTWAFPETILKDGWPHVFPPVVCQAKVRRLLESSPNKYSSSMVWLHLLMTEEMSALAASTFTQAEKVAAVPGVKELELAASTYPLAPLKESAFP